MGGSASAARRYRQLQRGILSSAPLTQRANLGTEHVTSQRRPRESRLHDVVPIALPVLSRLVLLVVVVTTLVPLPLLVVLLVVLTLVLLLTVLLAAEAAPCPMTAKQSRKARVDAIFMMRLRAG